MTANKRNRFGTVEACVQFDAVCDKLVSNGKGRKCMAVNEMYRAVSHGLKAFQSKWEKDKKDETEIISP